MKASETMLVAARQATFSSVTRAVQPRSGESVVASRFALLVAEVCLAILTLPVYADTFGSGVNEFTVDFVTVGNAGNGNDLGAGGGVYSSPSGGVGYNYRIATYEVSQDMIDKATAIGLSNVVAGMWTGNQPAADISWFEAAVFVNWLNTNQGYHAAYDLTYNTNAISAYDEWIMGLWDASEQASTGVDSGTNPYRHKDAVYFLPSEDEWYKAAYHQNDGVTANYWDYATQDNYPNPPDGIDSAGDPAYEAVFTDNYDQRAPNGVQDAGTSTSAYGTFGQSGNVWEWMESADDGMNNSTSELRRVRGGSYNNLEPLLRSSNPNSFFPFVGQSFLGFRVASILPIMEPRLDIKILGTNKMSLEWSTNDTGFFLETASTIASETWETVTNSVSVVGQDYSVTVDATGFGGYFRLRSD